MSTRFILLLTLFWVAHLSATEFAPWFGNQYQFEARYRALYQKYHRVGRHHHADDLFSQLSLSFSPDPKVNGEAEILFADTRYRDFGFDSGKVTGRCLLLNDIIGDPVSLTSGLSFTFPIYSGLHDTSSFHTGTVETEAHLAVGKEYSCLDQWYQRQYALFAIGIATQGSPWIRLQYSWEERLCYGWAYELFAKSVFGFGKRRLHISDFNGYGAIAHRSIDLGIKLNYILDFSGILSFEYAYRVFAQNFPKNTHLVQLTYFYPFSL
ncbi:MAG: hypothetical protein ACSNEK_04675 [Parachlamydiaceae bacterium]